MTVSQILSNWAAPESYVMLELNIRKGEKGFCTFLTMAWLLVPDMLVVDDETKGKGVMIRYRF